MKTQSTQASSAQQNLNNTKIPVNVAFSESDLICILQQRGFTVTAADEKDPLPEQSEKSATFTERRAVDSPMRSKPEQEIPVRAEANFGYRCASHALEVLWDKSADNLTTDELHWFAGLTESARQESSNLHELLMSLGALMGDTDSSAKPGDSELAAILFGAADQAKTLAELISIADCARDRLANPEHYARIRALKNENPD